MNNKPIGQVLKECGFITEEQIKVALSVQKSSDKFLGEILQDLDFITSDEIAAAVAKQHNLEYIDLSIVVPDKEALEIVPYEFSYQKSILPLYIDDDSLTVAMEEVNDIMVNDYLKKASQKNIKIVVSDKKTISKYCDVFYYDLKNNISSKISKVIEDMRDEEKRKKIDIPTLVDNLINQAMKNNATDIHISPEKDSTHIFYRIDGVLKHSFALPSSIHQEISSRLKILSDLDLAEQRRPQDGSFSHIFLNEEVSLRVSTIPTNFGENIVMRVLGKTSSLFSLEKLGMTKENILKVEKNFAKPNGVVLVVGPTGSGKTTTLYSALRKINSLEKNVMTIEDPIEYKFSFIKQTQLNEKAGYTFNAAIKSFMRQDPDVLLVGEIRDAETAELAIRASITGHLVLSTLHTNSAIGTIPRLEDLNVPPYLIASGLVAIISQRLIRKLCPHCRRKSEMLESEIKERINSYELFKKHWEGFVYEPVGCKKCNDTGYLGREVITEIFELDTEMQNLIIQQKSVLEMQEVAKRKGMLFMKDDGNIKVLQGKTSFKEINRVIN